MPKGGGGPDVPNVAPSSLTDISNEAISANIGNLPRLLQAFQQYGPQYANTINDIYAQSQRRLQELFPDQYGVQHQFAQNLQGALGSIGAAGGQAIPSTLLSPLLDQLRGSQAARGIATSPISALSESQAFGNLAEQYRGNISSEALQFLNTNPLETPGARQSLDTLGLTPISNTNLFQGGITQDAARVNNSYNQFSLQQQQYNNRQAANQRRGQLIGSLAGGALGSFLGPGGAYLGAQGGASIGGTFF